MQVARRAQRAERSGDDHAGERHEVERDGNHCHSIAQPLSIQKECVMQLLLCDDDSPLATMRPTGPPMKNESFQRDGWTRGGLSHSSTYGCHQSAPLPRDWMVCSYARSRAMRMLRERKK